MNYFIKWIEILEEDIISKDQVKEIWKYHFNQILD